MGLKLSGASIKQVLAAANETAKSRGNTLQESQAEHLQTIKRHVHYLQDPNVPKTYLAVTAILLTARALHPKDDLDVLITQAKEDPRGYAASSIGSTLAAFAKEQGIDLRAHSSQPMNNHPFTFQGRLSYETKVNVRYTVEWRTFVDAAHEINDMTPGEAKEALALLFFMARKKHAATVSVTVEGAGKETLDAVSAAVAWFVGEHSDNGKVGQSFAAALLDLVYGDEQVMLGDTQDPDVTTPGDVQVANEAGVWLWTEAKQKVIQTGDITGFLGKVKQVGGERVVYFALTNSTYSGYIKKDAVRKQAASLGMDVQIVESPQEAIDLYATFAPGSFAHLCSALLERLRARMTQSGCSEPVISEFDQMASQYAVLR